MIKLFLKRDCFIPEIGFEVIGHVLLVCVCVWVPAHTINFAFIPPSQRLLYINSIQIGYNVFLSFLGNKKVDDGSEGAVEEKKEL